MTTTIRTLLCSFPIIGKPVSLQSKSTKRQWQILVTRTAQAYHKKPCNIDVKLELQVNWFSQGHQNRPDVDNILKPILDALKNVIYVDDNQVSRVLVSHHDITSVLHFHDEPVQIIRPLLNGEKEYVYIRAYRVY